MRDESDDGGLGQSVDDAAQRPPQLLKQSGEVWPHWGESVPTTLRWIAFDGKLGRNVYESFSLVWSGGHLLSSLSGRNNKILPRNNRESHWGGVYRISLPGRSIDRFCGKDPTGTLYLGMAGTGAKGWSILNTRISSIAKNVHHATDIWKSAIVRQMYPWDSLAVEWAFVEKSVNAKGKNIAPKNAEFWLLLCYKESYGELPPLNQKG